VGTIVREYLARIQTTAKSIALEKRYQTEIAEMEELKREVQQENIKLKEQLDGLTAEISKSLIGESKFTPDVLSGAIEGVKGKIKSTEEKLAQLNYGLNNSQGAMKKLDVYYEQFQGWAVEFEDAKLEQRKMIICQLVREIRVARGYELDIVLDMNYEQFLAG